MRKPSMPYWSIQSPKISMNPRTTRGFSVITSSSPKKSPMVELSPLKRRVAAVVIVDRVVQPLGNLDVLLPGRHERRIGVVGAREFREVLLGLVRRGIAEEAPIDLLARDSAAPRVGIVRTRAVRTGARRALAVVDDVGRVIDDDVQVQLHAAGVNGLREGVHIRVGAEMRIDARKIGDPVAVIAGGLMARRRPAPVYS